MQRAITHLFSVLPVLLAVSISAVFAQTVDNDEAVRARISRAKALIAMRNHAGAIIELESVRRETDDEAAHSVANVLLMHCFLEQGDYSRAENFLLGLFDGLKSRKRGATTSYYAVAGQVVKSARGQAERYRSLGIAVADRDVPSEALSDLDRMRGLLENVIEQSKAVSKDRIEAASALALLEEGSAARALLARDEYDLNRWKQEVADAREGLAESRTVADNGVQDDSDAGPMATSTRTVVIPAVATQSGPSERVTLDVVKSEESGKAESIGKPVRPRVVGAPPAGSQVAAMPVDVGPLLDFASEKIQATYPSSAKSLKVTGMVRVELIVDENGKVSEVTNVSGPLQLQRAARDAALKWKFRPLKRDGTPVRMGGFLNFNFSL